MAIAILTTTDTEATMPRPDSGAELRARMFLRELAAGECTALHPRHLSAPYVHDNGAITVYCGMCCRLVTLREPRENAVNDRADVLHGGGRASVSMASSPVGRVNGR
jgi:hypothetical protein